MAEKVWGVSRKHLDGLPEEDHDDIVASIREAEKRKLRRLVDQSPLVNNVKNPSPRVTPTFPPELKSFPMKKLRRMGVSIREFVLKCDCGKTWNAPIADDGRLGARFNKCSCGNWSFHGALMLQCIVCGDYFGAALQVYQGVFDPVGAFKKRCACDHRHHKKALTAPPKGQKFGPGKW